MTDTNGNMVNKYAYDEFGNLLNSDETIPNPFLYIGQYGVMEEENGLFYMRARYYDPEVGRFINKDPIKYLGGLNLFTYVGNNPIFEGDPLGVQPYQIPRIPPEWQPWSPPAANPDQRVPGASGSGCHDDVMTFCDDDGWCCDWDECLGECMAMCPIIKGPSTKTVKKCVKSHQEPVTICQGKVYRYPRYRK